MRWSNTLIPTLKETPAEAEITSHKLLLRAGLVRKLTGGLYTFLPLGLRALRKIEQIVREEMDRPARWNSSCPRSNRPTSGGKAAAMRPPPTCFTKSTTAPRRNGCSA